MPLDSQNISASIPLPKARVPQFERQWRRLRLSDRVQETADTTTYRFDVLDAPFRHLPGQAMTLELPMPEGSESRVFTISSAGLDPNHVECTVKAGPGAHATRWMHENLVAGTEIRALGPIGAFTLAYHPFREIIMIGGGSGFTPMMSMLRWLHARGESERVIVIQAAKTPADLLFRPELKRIARDMPQLRLFEVPSHVPDGEFWSGYRGRLDRAMLRSMVGQANGKVAFCCGPQGFMDHVKRVLCSEGLQSVDYHTESFGAEPAPVVHPSTEKTTIADTQTALVSFRGAKVALSSSHTLAEGLAAHKLRVPTACGAGMCGTCKLRLLDGEVEMKDAGGISSKDKEKGFILACCSTAKGPVSLADPD